MKAIKLFTFLFAASFLAGCGNAPEACFVPNMNLIEKGQEVFFDECSLFGDSWAWDFGDGGTANIAEPSHVFSTLGEYLVVLTYTKGGSRPDTYSEIILVANRKLGFVTVNDLPTTNSLGNPWDSGDAADPVLKMKPSSSGTWSLSTPINADMTMSLPFIWNMSSSAFPFTYESWDFLLLDDDGVSADTMGTWTIDLNANIYLERFIPLTGTDTDIEVHYSLN